MLHGFQWIVYVSHYFPFRIGILIIIILFLFHHCWFGGTGHKDDFFVHRSQEPQKPCLKILIWASLRILGLGTEAMTRWDFGLGLSVFYVWVEEWKCLMNRRANRGRVNAMHSPCHFCLFCDLPAFSSP